MANSRILSSEQVELLINISLAAEPEFAVILCTPDEQLRHRITRLFSGDARLRVEYVRQGADALLCAARIHPDLLVVDRALEDIPPAVLVAAIRRDPLLSDVVILGTGDRGDGDFGADDYFTADNLDTLYLKRKLGGLFPAKSGSGNRRNRGERRWPRIGLNLAGRIQAVCAGESGETTERVEGVAVIENISPGGAFLTGIQFDRDIPLDGAIKVRLDVDQPPLERWSAESAVIERSANGGVRVRFTGISVENRSKIAGLFA